MKDPGRNSQLERCLGNKKILCEEPTAMGESMMSNDASENPEAEWTEQRIFDVRLSSSGAGKL